MSYIEQFADIDLLELAQVKGYRRKIHGVLTDVRSAQRGGPSASDPSGKSNDQNKLTADQILAAKVPGPLTPVQKMLIQERSKAYRDIATKHMKDNPHPPKHVGMARDVLIAMSKYYDSLVNETANYETREKLRVRMESKRLILKNEIRHQVFIKSIPPPFKGPDPETPPPAA